MRSFCIFQDFCFSGRSKPTPPSLVLSSEAKKLLRALDASFKAKSLPNGPDLAIKGCEGLAITALIGLTAKQSEVALPLASWGSGTLRLAALAISEENHDAAPITLVDEAERGLEPYRQRTFLKSCKREARKSS